MFAETERFEDNILTALGEDTCTLLVETAERLGVIIAEELGE